MPEVEEVSFIQVESGNAVLSCMKLVEESDDCIAGIYDAMSMGAEAEVLLSLDVQEAYEDCMLEKRLSLLIPKIEKA